MQDPRNNEQQMQDPRARTRAMSASPSNSLAIMRVKFKRVTIGWGFQRRFSTHFLQTKAILAEWMRAEPELMRRGFCKVRISMEKTMRVWVRLPSREAITFFWGNSREIEKSKWVCTGPD
jgi:hypothetical protein